MSTIFDSVFVQCFFILFWSSRPLLGGHASLNVPFLCWQTGSLLRGGRCRSSPGPCWSLLGWLTSTCSQTPKVTTDSCTSKVWVELFTDGWAEIFASSQQNAVAPSACTPATVSPGGRCRRWGRCSTAWRDAAHTSTRCTAATVDRRAAVSLWISWTGELCRGIRIGTVQLRQGYPILQNSTIVISAQIHLLLFTSFILSWCYGPKFKCVSAAETLMTDSCWSPSGAASSIIAAWSRSARWAAGRRGSSTLRSPVRTQNHDVSTANPSKPKSAALLTSDQFHTWFSY